LSSPDKPENVCLLNKRLPSKGRRWSLLRSAITGFLFCFFFPSYFIISGGFDFTRIQEGCDLFIESIEKNPMSKLLKLTMDTEPLAPSEVGIIPAPVLQFYGEVVDPKLDGKWRASKFVVPSRSRLWYVY
jgi:hypothetical protein